MKTLKMLLNKRSLSLFFFHSDVGKACDNLHGQNSSFKAISVSTHSYLQQFMGLKKCVCKTNLINYKLI